MGFAVESIWVVALVAISPASAQNVIPNSSFEDFSIGCVFGVGYNSVIGWTIPGCSNPPYYFNACNVASASYAATPSNDWGYEVPVTGDAYCGIIPFSLPIPGGNVQCYASVPLTTALQAGEEYCIRFWLSLADSSSYSTGVLHAFLWYDVPSRCNYNDTMWDTHAAVTFDLSPVDTSGWTLLEGSFIAQGGEVNLTLGSFLYGAEIDTTYLGTNHVPTDLTMYYIDDVYLAACDVGVNEQLQTNELRLHPNPAVDQIGVSAKIDQDAFLEIVDVLGKVYSRTRVTGLTTMVDIAQLVPGGYFVRVSVSGNTNAYPATQYFVKQAE